MKLAKYASLDWYIFQWNRFSDSVYWYNADGKKPGEESRSAKNFFSGRR
jgi:hypothetical protein